MTSGVDVDGRFQGSYVEGFLDAPFDPVTFRRQNRDIIFAEMVAMLTGMLQHGGFEVTESVGSSGGVLLKSSIDCPFGFACIPAWAWRGISSSARYVVYVSIGLFFFNLVFRFHKHFSE